MTTVGVAGATGALGKEILAVLDKAPWRPEKVVALASTASTVPTVEYGDQTVSVDDVGSADLGDLDAIILALPRDVAREVGERAIGEGLTVVDCSGAFAEDEDVPMIVPWVNPEALEEPPLRGVVAIPHAPAILLASVLGPLRRAGIEGELTATVLVPASSEGRDGIEELSRQVVALFNSTTPPRKVFEQGLAFDLLPQIGASRPDGWTDREQDVLAELQTLLGELHGAVTLLGVPVFSGISATITLRTPGPLPLEKVGQILQAGGVQIPPSGPRQLPRPRKVEGHPFVHVGRLRNGVGGLHLWASLDNLRGAAAVAVGCAGALLRAQKRA